MKDYNKVFKQELEKLNEKQRIAVEKIEGPILVIAGPGTGKTQIIAARIGTILKETDTAPENILCLTYTDAGTIAMRNRLYKFIGPDAYKVNIFTFHAFCNMVIQDNLEVFGVRELDPISELEEIELLRKLIDGFGADHPLKRWTGDVYYEVGRLKKLFSVMKTEGWTPELIASKTESYLEDCQNSDDFRYKRANNNKGIKAGDLNQNKYDDECRKMRELVAGAQEFTRYQQMMLEAKRYDYNDMILWVLEKFKTDESLLRQYQEQYHYFLVDEYQDTNGAQNEILQQLISYWGDEPNVFVVGDDDQSIYRFQGANVANIMDFYNQYKNTVEVVVMTDNYRSTQQILDASKEVINRNAERLIKTLIHLGIDKNLIARHPDFANLEIKPKVVEYFNPAHEAAGVANSIVELQQKEVPLGEVAVIYRNHKQCENLIQYLQNKGISVNIRRKANILDSIFINNIINILIFIEGETRIPHSREDMLFEMLHYDFFKIDPLVIAEVALEMRSAPYNGKQLKWREMLKQVKHKISPSLFSNNRDENFEKMLQLSNNIEYWISAAKNKTIQGLFEKIITSGGILNFVMKSDEKVELMQELHTFFEFIKNENARNPRLSLADLLKTISLMRQFGIALEINKTAFAENGVNFITAHSSKGLEFEYVFVIGCNKNTWDSKGRSGTYSIPENLLTKASGEESEEARRLFYVAMTRAKRNLQISYAAEDNGKQLEKSRFVAELESATGLLTEKVIIPDIELLEFNFTLLQESNLLDPEWLHKNHLKKLLESYSLSVTHLSTYLKCPISFYFNNLLKVPSAKNQYMAFGSAVHYALEELFRQMVKHDKNVFPAKEEFLKYFNWYMNRSRECFTDEEFKNRMAYGKEILPEYYDKYLNEWNKIVSLERNINNAEVKGISINGKIDKIEFDGKNANVVDYKTGQYSKSKKKFAPPVEGAADDASFEEKYGGDYWRQAVFYSILIGQAKPEWNIVSTEFDFVEPDSKNGQYSKHKIHITELDILTVTRQIETAYEKIMNLEFSKGCNDENCKWCNFVNANYKVLKETEEEMVEL